MKVHMPRTINFPSDVPVVDLVRAMSTLGLIVKNRYDGDLIAFNPDDEFEDLESTENRARLARNFYITESHDQGAANSLPSEDDEQGEYIKKFCHDETFADNDWKDTVTTLTIVGLSLAAFVVVAILMFNLA